MDSKERLATLLESCCEHLKLKKGRLSFWQQATNLQSTWKEIEPYQQENLLIEDFLEAIQSEPWGGMEPVMGSRLSKLYSHRLKIELMTILDSRLDAERLEIEEAKHLELERDPSYRAVKACRQYCTRFFPDDEAQLETLLPYLIWHLMPQYRDRFRLRGCVYTLNPPEEFLTTDEIKMLCKAYGLVFLADDVSEAAKALVCQWQTKIPEPEELK
jgi:hypothetical protein